MMVQPGQRLDQDQRRYYQRLNLNDAKLIRFVDPKLGNIFPVRNISYGGMLLQKGPLNSKDFKRLIQGKLVFMGDEIPAQIEIIHESDHNYGVRFIHEEADVLLFLREKLEYVRFGDTLRPIPKSDYNERYQDGTWEILHGDGPVSLRVKYNSESSEKIDRFEMTIRPMEYATVLYEQGKVREARMHEYAVHLKSEVVSEEFGLAPELARCAALIIMGIQQTDLRHRLDHFVPLLLQEAGISA